MPRSTRRDHRAVRLRPRCPDCDAFAELAGETAHCDDCGTDWVPPDRYEPRPDWLLTDEDDHDEQV